MPKDERNKPLIKDDFTPNAILIDNQPLHVKQLFAMLVAQTNVNQLNERVQLVSKVTQNLLDGVLNPEVCFLKQKK